MITTRALSRQFNGLTAVKDLDLDIGAGEVFGFLGPNGAGKTTTVRLLTCLITPTSGSATVMGLTVGTDDQDIRRHTGILTETPGLYDRLSAWQNLTIFAELYEVDDTEYQVEKYLRLLDLWERRNDPAGTFSKGMRQKLAIARALLHEPQVLFLDEPTAGLDPAASRLVRDFIAELRSEGRTIFLCTHNLDEADRLCDRVAVFQQTLRVVDTPDRLRRQVFGHTVRVQLAQEAAPFVAHLQELPFVGAIEAHDNTLTLSLSDPGTDNPHLVRHLVQQGAAVQYVSAVERSLEDVYLRLLRRDGDPRDVGAGVA